MPLAVTDDTSNWFDQRLLGGAAPPKAVSTVLSETFFVDTPKTR
jgi:hypothetical protein